MVDTMTSYRLIALNMTRSLDRVAHQPVVEREAAYYRESIANVKSIDDFMADPRIYNFAMKAFGLEDMAYAKAFVRKVLTEGITDKESFANSLTDKRYKEFATVFNFAAEGAKTTAKPEAQQGIVDKYLRQTLEQDAGQQNEGVRLALYFERKASSLTNVYEILGDRALLTVVQNALGIPSFVSGADIDKQAAMIEKRLDIKSFSDPEEVKKFLTRFTAMYEYNNPSAGSAQSVASVLLGNGSPIGISSAILTTLQSFKPGGR